MNALDEPSVYEWRVSATKKSDTAKLGDERC
jgi:hypothetical protein